MNTLENLTTAIHDTNNFFLKKAQKQVNVATTMRNWLIGNYIIEYEQLGADRATYGQKVLVTLADRLRQLDLKGMAETKLKLFRQLYLIYPQIGQTLSDQFNQADLQQFKIGRVTSDLFNPFNVGVDDDLTTKTNVSWLVDQLSFFTLYRGI